MKIFSQGTKSFSHGKAIVSNLKARRFSSGGELKTLLNSMTRWKRDSLLTPSDSIVLGNQKTG